jgi:anti-sigma factor RsiW
MSCNAPDCQPDWKAYALGELEAADRHRAETHAAACMVCREELATLRLTLDALSTLRDEEIPRRIAFVSDKVFEPNWWQRWTRSFLRPSFAGACVIAAAILVHAVVRPAALPVVSSIDTAAVESRIESEVLKRIDVAVNKAVSETQQRQEQKTAELLAASEKRYAEQRRADFATAAENFDMLRKQVVQMYALNTGAGVR